ncbi:hypothetical protein D7322_28000 [Sphingobacterium puteale]|uniref:Uncharacterized protein n=1 Tax=Sphingobacterium puteale TaxID=2420510 RepID=A0A420VPP3_9SPHI|nr:hypothetical protein [Sphingobacterium puteale]RKO68289.1 hypothetical protein D7322_28000 [Sphingobacterium puteale]
MKALEEINIFIFDTLTRVLFDTVHFPQSLANYPLRGAGIYLIEGKVVLEYDCPSIEVIRCAKMPLKPDPRSE